jgi:metallophosphoesterase (TIGR03768 family)
MPNSNWSFTRRGFIKTAGVAGLALGAVAAGLPLASCKDDGNGPDGTETILPKPEEYPIDSTVITTLTGTIAFDTTVTGLGPKELSSVAQYGKYGYGKWMPGAPLLSEPRTDIMPSGYSVASVTKKAKLLNFFAVTDIHITDKESPSQLIYLQQLYYPTPIPNFGNYPWAWVTSVYSPVMLYTTQVLDAAVQTVNALHKQNPIDFGISLGDTCNSTQYNELRWYIDVLDGKVITPSSGAHAGADRIDYQKSFKAAGLDKSIPWYQTLGNHDHFWVGSIPVNAFLRQSYISDTVVATGDVLLNPANVYNPVYYMGVIDGSTPNGDIKHAGPVVTFNNPPKVVADADRRSLLRTEWIKEFSSTTSTPVGHGFNLVDPNQEKGFACYSFVPKSNIPIKVIVLDDTQREDDNSSDIHGHGFLDPARWTWLKKELADGDAADQLMIIAAHIPLGVEPLNSGVEWWNNSGNPLGTQNIVTFPGLITELQSHPNLILWISGHLHHNTIKAFPGPTPEQGFWQVETSSLRDFPQQFRTFEIYLNSDNTISIVATNVDPAAKDGTPAATSRKYAIATQQLTKNTTIYQDPSELVSLTDQSLVKDSSGKTVPDPSIRSMPTGSYNAELFKRLSPQMQAKMQIK